MADYTSPMVNIPAYYGLLQMNRSLLLSNNNSEAQNQPYSFGNANMFPYIDFASRKPNMFPESSVVAKNLDPGSSSASNVRLSSRAKRTFVPNEHKDVFYWMKRLKNNVSARRSRVKRKVLEQYMERKLAELQTENNELKQEIELIRKQCDCHRKNTSSIEVPNNFEDAEVISRPPSLSESPTSGSESESWTKEFFTDREASSSSEETDPELSTSGSDLSSESPTDRKKVPHKIRLKLHLHSAFSKH